jgi:hypothetical protein
MSKEKEAIDFFYSILDTHICPEKSRQYFHTAIGALKKQMPSCGYSIPVQEDPLVPPGQAYFVCDGKIVGAITNLKGDSGE